MAMALMIQELNAANFSSGAADAGEVLTADGAGGAGWAAPPAGGMTSLIPGGQMVVSGAGNSSANGTYTPQYVQGGKMSWRSSNNKWIVWGEGMWKIWKTPFPTYYTSAEDVATPDLVTAWTGTAPGPTVTPQDSPVDEGKAPLADGAGGVTWTSGTLAPATDANEKGRVLKESYGYPEWSPLTVQRLNSVIGDGATPPTAAMINAVVFTHLGRYLWQNEPILFMDGYRGKVVLAFYDGGGMFRAVALEDIT